MNKFAKLLADADVETVAKLQALASFEIAIATQRIASALEKIMVGTVGLKEQEERLLHEAIAAVFESNSKS